MHAVTLFIASLFCSLGCNLSADTPPIRVSLKVTCQNCDNDANLVSALSHEFRKLDDVLVTDTQPELKVDCVVVQMDKLVKDARLVGYTTSVAITSIDDRLITHTVVGDKNIELLAHRIAALVDGSVIEQWRRDAQPSSSP